MKFFFSLSEFQIHKILVRTGILRSIAENKGPRFGSGSGTGSGSVTGSGSRIGSRRTQILRSFEENKSSRSGSSSGSGTSSGYETGSCSWIPHASEFVAATAAAIPLQIGPSNAEEEEIAAAVAKHNKTQPKKRQQQQKKQYADLQSPLCFFHIRYSVKVFRCEEAAPVRQNQPAGVRPTHTWSTSAFLMAFLPPSPIATGLQRPPKRQWRDDHRFRGQQAGAGRGNIAGLSSDGRKAFLVD
jgi:hypothetical protein